MNLTVLAALCLQENETKTAVAEAAAAEVAAEPSSQLSTLLGATESCHLPAQVLVAAPAESVPAIQPACWPAPLPAAPFPAAMTEPDAVTAPAESQAPAESLAAGPSKRHDISSTKHSSFAVADAPAHAVQNESALRNLTMWPPPVSYSSSKTVAAEAREAALAEAQAAVHHRPLSVATMQRLLTQTHTRTKTAASV